MELVVCADVTSNNNHAVELAPARIFGEVRLWREDGLCGVTLFPGLYVGSSGLVFWADQAITDANRHEASRTDLMREL